MGKLDDAAATLMELRGQSGYRGAAVEGIQFTAKSRRWENFSIGRFRGQDKGGPEESGAAGGRLHLAISYSPDGSIALFATACRTANLTLPLSDRPRGVCKFIALATKMRLSVPRIADLDSEPEETRGLYGLDNEATAPLARNCLLARRLSEQGVRFVQVNHGGSGKSWDAHGNLVSNPERMAGEYDRPVAALLADLDRRRLLAETLVMGVTEFGRAPVSQGSGASAGRDHHPACFTVWMAGRGLKPGFAYGASDELGDEPAGNPVTSYDLHATALHALGIDHERLSFYHNGIRRRLTDVHGLVSSRPCSPRPAPSLRLRQHRLRV